jgi:hypothetical protein
MGMLPIVSSSYDELPQVLKDKHPRETVEEVRKGRDERDRPIFIIRTPAEYIPYEGDDSFEAIQAHMKKIPRYLFEYHKSRGKWSLSV